MQTEQFRQIVEEARSAPSPLNTQPARWRRKGDAILIGCDPEAVLKVSDPNAVAAGLACGMAAEATILALSSRRMGAVFTDQWAQDDRDTLPGLRMAGRITLEAQTDTDPLAKQLPLRFGHRGPYEPGPVDLYGWTRRDALLITDASRRDWLADLYDRAMLTHLRRPEVRHELLSWLRIRPRHPRKRYDGLDRAALQLEPRAAFKARLALGPLWRPAEMFGAVGQVTSEAEQIRSSAVIALFHRPATDSPVTAGRALLRLLLEATKLGLAAWPMGVLTADDAARDEIARTVGLDPERRLLQVVRLGRVKSRPGRMARRPLEELIV
jgi:nitroreductase